MNRKLQIIRLFAVATVLPVIFLLATENSFASFFNNEGMITDFMERIEDDTTLPRGNFESELIPNVIQLILALFATILTGMAVWAGILFVTQFGNEERVRQARNYLVWSLVGIAVTAVSYAVVYGVLNLDFSPT